MAWDDFMAVRNSDLYENEGLAKPTLSFIALLMVRADEDEEVTAEEGFCFASQQYLAAQLGCSESTVQKWAESFVRDGWLALRVHRDQHGHPHNWYCFGKGKLEEIVTRRMPMDENGRYERKRNPNKRRETSFRGLTAPSREDEDHDALLTREARVNDASSHSSSQLGAVEQDGSERRSFTARSGKPYGSEPSQKLERVDREELEKAERAELADEVKEYICAFDLDEDIGDFRPRASVRPNHPNVSEVGSDEAIICAFDLDEDIS